MVGLDVRSSRIITTVMGSLLIFFVVFAGATISKFDFLSVSGLDVLFAGGTESSRFTVDYVLWRTFFNLVIGILGGLAGFLYLSLMGTFARRRALAVEKFSQRESKPRTGAIKDDNLTREIRPKAVSFGRYGEVIRRLNDNIEGLQRRASIIYWTILAALVVGIILIIFAGYLSSFDTTYSNLNLQIQSERQAVMSDIARSFARRPSFEPRDPDSEEGASRTYPLSRLESLDKQSMALVSAVTQQLTERPETKQSWNWGSTFLRIGVIGLLVFLTQILISLYRYNSRLIAFYSSRRDALLLSDGGHPSIRKYTDILFPANLDFGREPRHPLQEIRAFLGRKHSPANEGGERQRTRNSSSRGRKTRTNGPTTPPSNSAEQTVQGAS
jgi:hypothetical protein